MNITVYSTATCAYCVMLKRWFDEMGIKYTEKRVDVDQDAAREMVGLSGQMGVPFTTIQKPDGSISGVLGFDRPTIEHLLKG